MPLDNTQSKRYLRLLVGLSLLLSALVQAAPKKALLPQWQGHNPQSSETLDHQPWQTILDQYLSSDAQQQTYFDYQAASQDPELGLGAYLVSLTQIDPLGLNRQEQKAYWINLYNAATVDLIIQRYPVKSITKLGKGLFSFGPWNQKILTINNTPVSLNDIEHGILRPIYNDPRIHYAVNCASLSCPNLMAQAFTAQNTESLMDQAAKDYINHPRGVTIKDNGTLVLSSIYQWYATDFGDNSSALLEHLINYANRARKAQLQALADDPNIRYDYNWKLNQPPTP